MTEIPGSAAPWLQDGLVIVAILSIIAGNLLALRQDNLKRLLACSSIAHLGYLLTALAAGGLAATETLLVYVLTYLATTLGIFGIVAMRSSAAHTTDTDLIADYRGLARSQPWLGAIMAVMLLSLAGIPLTAGFIGKLYIFVNGVQAQQWALLAAVIIGSTVGLAYYLRVLVTLFLPVTGASPAAAEPAPRPVMLAILAGLAVVVLWLGTWPQPALEFVRSLSASLPV